MILGWTETIMPCVSSGSGQWDVSGKTLELLTLSVRLSGHPKKTTSVACIQDNSHLMTIENDWNTDKLISQQFAFWLSSYSQ